MNQANYILQNQSSVIRYNNENCIIANNTYRALLENIGCTYLIYMHENLRTNTKHIYSSNWDWQNHLIGERLINNCPIFLTAFRYLEQRKHGRIFVPWADAPPRNKEERNVCGLRSEFNIGHGFGYGATGHGIRETLAFGGDILDKTFYRNFITDMRLFYRVLQEMRIAILLNEYAKIITIDYKHLLTIAN